MLPRDIGAFWILPNGQLWTYRKKPFHRFSQRCMLNKCEIGEALYVEAFDCMGSEVYGVTELSRK